MLHTCVHAPQKEMEGMAGRIAKVRGELRKSLEGKYPGKDWSFITNQIGMFSFTGLSPAQVDNMTNKHHIFMTRDGRISLAGLNSAKVDYLATAMVDSFKTSSSKL
jgi:aspartate aminotransferase